MLLAGGILNASLRNTAGLCGWRSPASHRADFPGDQNIQLYENINMLIFVFLWELGLWANTFFVFTINLHPS